MSGTKKITETENDGKQGDRHQSRFTDFLALAKNSELAQEFTELRKNYVAEQSRLRINGTFVDQDRLRKNYVAEQARLRQKIQDLSESKKIMEGDADGRKEKAQSRFALRKSLRENGNIRVGGCILKQDPGYLFYVESMPHIDLLASSFFGNFE